jgi:lipopolysaccharide transport system ATP-binding protein
MTNSLEYAVDIIELTKEFNRRSIGKGYSSLKSRLAEIFSSNKKIESKAIRHRVLDGLTMRIPKGLSMGVIGKNGAGKSTLLKLITGIYKPTSGSISLNGRVAALIELGAGFHPDFSGRENVYLGGVMQGMTREEIRSKFDDIVKFAELEESIDEPVRTYSSGMFMRLGFSLAIHTNPDVLIVDEVLAVGDARFVAKCQDKISELRAQGKTLILVTHDLSAVERWCDEAIWLQGGVVKDRGDPRRVIDSYRQWVENVEENELLVEDASIQQQVVESADKNDEFKRWGSREVEIISVKLLGEHGHEKRVFHPDEPVDIQIQYKLNEKVEDPVFGIGIHRSDGVTIIGTNTDLDRFIVHPNKQGVISYKIKRIGLLDGSYRLDVATHRQDGYPYDYLHGVIHFACRWSGNQVGVTLPQASWHHLEDLKQETSK